VRIAAGGTAAQESFSQAGAYARVRQSRRSVRAAVEKSVTMVRKVQLPNHAASNAVRRARQVLEVNAEVTAASSGGRLERANTPKIAETGEATFA